MLQENIDAAKHTSYKIFARYNPDWARKHPMVKGGRLKFEKQLVKEEASKAMQNRINSTMKISEKVSHLIQSFFIALPFYALCVRDALCDVHFCDCTLC